MLDLIAPLKYYVQQRARTDDRHVYGAKSRFLTRAVMACFDEVVFGDAPEKEAAAEAGPAVDVAGKLRGMWA